MTSWSCTSLPLALGNCLLFHLTHLAANNICDLFYGCIQALLNILRSYLYWNQTMALEKREQRFLYAQPSQSCEEVAVQRTIMRMRDYLSGHLWVWNDEGEKDLVFKDRIELSKQQINFLVQTRLNRMDKYTDAAVNEGACRIRTSKNTGELICSKMPVNPVRLRNRQTQIPQEQLLWKELVFVISHVLTSLASKIGDHMLCYCYTEAQLPESACFRYSISNTAFAKLKCVAYQS